MCVVTRIDANVRLQVQHKLKRSYHSRAAHIIEVRALASQPSSPVESQQFFSLVISPAKCPSLNTPDNDGHNPALLRFRFPLSFEDKM